MRPTKTYLSTFDVAARLGLSVSRVQQFMREGRLSPDARTLGNNNALFLAETCDRFAASRARK